MSKSALEAHFWARAKEIAKSGQCRSVLAIEQKLWREGCENPAALLGAGWSRDELMALIECSHAIPRLDSACEQTQNF